jgi:hypothetical protein
MALIKHCKEWSIGRHRVQVEVAGMAVVVRTDGVTALELDSKMLGTWSFDVGSRAVDLRRVRTLDVARSELWIDGIKVPPTPEPIARRRAPKDAHCEKHATRSEPTRSEPVYRKPGLAPLAKIECGVCHAAICVEHRAVDNVRCTECFADAAAQLQREERAIRVKGVGIALGLVLAIGVVGVVTDSPKIITCAVGAAFVGLFSVVGGLLKERGILREQQATRAEQKALVRYKPKVSTRRKRD